MSDVEEFIKLNEKALKALEEKDYETLSTLQEKFVNYALVLDGAELEYAKVDKAEVERAKKFFGKNFILEYNKYLQILHDTFLKVSPFLYPGCEGKGYFAVEGAFDNMDEDTREKVFSFLEEYKGVLDDVSGTSVVLSLSISQKYIQARCGADNSHAISLDIEELYLKYYERPSAQAVDKRLPVVERLCKAFNGEFEKNKNLLTVGFGKLDDALNFLLCVFRLADLDVFGGDFSVKDATEIAMNGGVPCKVLKTKPSEHVLIKEPKNGFVFECDNQLALHVEYPDVDYTCKPPKLKWWLESAKKITFDGVTPEILNDHLPKVDSSAYNQGLELIKVFEKFYYSDKAEHTDKKEESPSISLLVNEIKKHKKTKGNFTEAYVEGYSPVYLSGEEMSLDDFIIAVLPQVKNIPSAIVGKVLEVSSTKLKVFDYLHGETYKIPHNKDTYLEGIYNIGVTKFDNEPLFVMSKNYEAPIVDKYPIVDKKNVTYKGEDVGIKDIDCVIFDGKVYKIGEPGVFEEGDLVIGNSAAGYNFTHKFSINEVTESSNDMVMLKCVWNSQGNKESYAVNSHCFNKLEEVLDLEVVK